MTFFEKELRKIIGEQYPDATYVGNACYIRLSDMNRAKIQFTTRGNADNYSALQLSVLNCNEGVVDKLMVRFEDIWGKKQMGQSSVSPHIWNDYGECAWYGYHPNSGDYQALANAVTDYLDVFQEQSQVNDRQWQQTM